MGLAKDLWQLKSRRLTKHGSNRQTLAPFKGNQQEVVQTWLKHVDTRAVPDHLRGGPRPRRAGSAPRRSRLSGPGGGGRARGVGACGKEGSHQSELFLFS